MISIKNSYEIEAMSEGGKVLGRIVKELKKRLAPGLAAQQLDELAQELIFDSGAKPAFKGYRGFPNALCVSINEQIVHGISSSRIIKEGNIVSLDLGLIWKGYYLDKAITSAVGSVDPEAHRLIRAVKKSLKRGIGQAKAGKHLGDISFAIQKHIEGQGFQVIRELCGHGVGKKLHEEPEILNFGQRHKGPRLKKGMTLAIEPMACLGRPAIKKGPDGFSYQTADNSLSAHSEDTILITGHSAKVLTE